MQAFEKRLVVVSGHPTAGKTPLAWALRSNLGPLWSVFGLGDYINDREKEHRSLPWAIRRPLYVPIIGGRIRRQLRLGGGAIFEGVLVDQWELDSLIEAAGLARLREYVITVGLCRDIESAYRDKLRTVDPEWAEREGIHSIEDYRKGFYEPYSPKGIMFNLLFENRTPGDPVVVAEILKRVRTRQTESPKSA